MDLCERLIKETVLGLPSFREALVKAATPSAMLIHAAVLPTPFQSVFAHDEPALRTRLRTFAQCLYEQTVAANCQSDLTTVLEDTSTPLSLPRLTEILMNYEESCKYVSYLTMHHCDSCSMSIPRALLSNLSPADL